MRVEHQIVEGTLTFADASRGLLNVTCQSSDIPMRALPLQALSQLRTGSEVTLLVQHTSEFSFPEAIAARQAPVARLRYLGASLAWHTLAVGVGLLALAMYAKLFWLALPAAVIGLLHVTLSVRRAHTLRTFAKLLAERPAAVGSTSGTFTTADTAAGSTTTQSAASSLSAATTAAATLAVATTAAAAAAMENGNVGSGIPAA
jgi:hypothetical protein